ncbi:MAG: EVE domain-containing protein [Bdellovibrionota bacterium]
MKYWLMKTEPDVFSIDDLAKKGESLWDGVRNYQARNFMMNDMKVGDTVLFYHSNATPSGVVGLAKVAKPAKPDPSQFDKKSEYYDPKATPEKPRWFCVTVGFDKKFKKEVSLEVIKETKSLKDMILVHRSRLSVQPVLESEFKTICKMGGL